MPGLALGGALGALLAYFFDPENGRRRRRQAVDRVTKKVQHLREEPKEFDDATLTDKVRSEALRSKDIPSGDIAVNVQEGVVQLRGEVERAELIDELVDRVRSVQGVREVENLLHLPGTPAPTHE